MLILLILKILEEYSDEDHHLTQQEIIKLLKLNYDMDCDRRSVKSNILSLKEMGYDIDMTSGYFLAERKFENVELRMLIDSVLFSKTIGTRQAKVLIEKLKSMGNRYFQAKVSHVSNLPELQHTDNKQVLYALDCLNDAIDRGRKVSFIYNSYGTDFKLHPRKDEPYVVNPYQMVANNGRYYLIGNYDKYDNISHYRLDRMTKVRIMEEKRKPVSEIGELDGRLNLPKHMAEHMYMFSGRSVDVIIVAEKHLMSELVDWFGKRFHILEENDDIIKIRVRCNESAMQYIALQYGSYMEVLSPESLRTQISEDVWKMAKKYEKSCIDG
ncbi:MAG TPA: WYL domain-containing protein [Lachnospiraceae bacterium]|nr:WYL domain-containing protein [Lachnospiraceae bacterium]